MEGVEGFRGNCNTSRMRLLSGVMWQAGGGGGRGWVGGAPGWQRTCCYVARVVGRENVDQRGQHSPVEVNHGVRIGYEGAGWVDGRVVGGWIFACLLPCNR